MSRRLEALRALAERGSTPGERAAAAQALRVHLQPAPAPAAPERFARPAKLPNGTWGVLVPWPVRPGEVVDVEARNGKRWTAVIAAVQDSGAAGHICAVKPRIFEQETPPDLRVTRGMTYRDLCDVLVRLAGAQALQDARIDMLSMDRKERRKHLYHLIAVIQQRAN